MAKKNDERFVKVYENGSFLWEKAIFIDRQTGVNYLYIGSGNSGGVTPLLDANGKPVVTPIPNEYPED